MKRFFILLAALTIALPALAKRDIRIDPDYDPRVELRVVVLPALKDKALKKANERTISALFSTELLRSYEVLDLLRFEQFLADRKFQLNDAFSQKAKSVVRDSAKVDAIASLEIYRWDPGQGGIPLLSRKSGQIACRARMMDPFSGRIYWSVNRIENVKPGTDFFDRSTELFSDLIDDLNKALERKREKLNRNEGYAEQLAAGRDPYDSRLDNRRFSASLAREKGFSGNNNTPDASTAQNTLLPEQTKQDTLRSSTPVEFPPLYEGNKYEDSEDTTLNSSLYKPTPVNSLNYTPEVEDVPSLNNTVSSDNKSLPSGTLKKQK